VATALGQVAGVAAEGLVVGVAPDQVVELAGLVAVIAGRSRVRPAPAEDDERGEEE
jgi:hypothetical protein